MQHTDHRPSAFPVQDAKSPGRALRFTVGNGTKRASTLWLAGVHDGSLYVGTRTQAGHLKLTFQSPVDAIGEIRLGGKPVRYLPIERARTRQPAACRSDRPIKALSLIFPGLARLGKEGIVTDEARKPVTQIPSAPISEAIEVNFLYWPAQLTIQATDTVCEGQLISFWPLNSATCIVVVWRKVPFAEARYSAQPREAGFAGIRVAGVDRDGTLRLEQHRAGRHPSGR